MVRISFRCTIVQHQWNCATKTASYCPLNSETQQQANPERIVLLARRKRKQQVSAASSTRDGPPGRTSSFPSLYRKYIGSCEPKCKIAAATRSRRPTIDRCARGEGSLEAARYRLYPRRPPSPDLRLRAYTGRVSLQRRKLCGRCDLHTPLSLACTSEIPDNHAKGPWLQVNLSEIRKIARNAYSRVCVRAPTADDADPSS